MGVVAEGRGVGMVGGGDEDCVGGVGKAVKVSLVVMAVVSDVVVGTATVHVGKVIAWLNCGGGRVHCMVAVYHLFISGVCSNW